MTKTIKHLQTGREFHIKKIDNPNKPIAITLEADNGMTEVAYIGAPKMFQELSDTRFDPAELLELALDFQKERIS